MLTPARIIHGIFYDSQLRAGSDRTRSSVLDMLSVRLRSSSLRSGGSDAHVTVRTRTKSFPTIRLFATLSFENIQAGREAGYDLLLFLNLPVLFLHLVQ